MRPAAETIPATGAMLTWIDICVVIVLLIGFWRGLRRGISVELIGVLQWLATVVLAALFYKPLSIWLGPILTISNGYAQVTGYLAIACVIHFIFSRLKASIGERLENGDPFGAWEYRLGLVAGGLRHACILLVFMAVLHARAINPAERAAFAKMQADNFGSISFPTLGSAHQSIFEESFTGRWVQKKMPDQLIQPAKPGERPSLLPKTIIRSETLQILNQP